MVPQIRAQNESSPVTPFSQLASRKPKLTSTSGNGQEIGDHSIQHIVRQEAWFQQTLSIVVVGASGDLAKKKTYPSLLHLFESELLPRDLVIWGYARSAKTHDELRQSLYPHLQETGVDDSIVQKFLQKCFYHSGTSYGDEKAVSEVVSKISQFETNAASSVGNRLFYLAVPPNVFGESGIAIKRVGMATTGWTRVVIEKPFGRDLESCDELLNTLSQHFQEDYLYRIDHYLGKEIVQNLLLMRFGNNTWEPLWNRNVIESVQISFKEPFGTEGRGGYFDNYGIIRDILQNHLMQVLSVFAMEPPAADDGDSIRDAKTEVLKHMDPLRLEDAFLGQYDGYTEDDTIKDKNTNCPTYAALRCWIHNSRWEGVPFLLEAGKAMDEKLCEVRVRFKTPSTLESVRGSANQLSQNELVLRLQPNPAIELHTNMKTPGLATDPMTGVMSMAYNDIPNLSNPDAYTRLLLDVLRGRKGSFVRDDELRRSWELFTPLLHAIEGEGVRPLPYEFGSTGPKGRDAWFSEMGTFREGKANARLSAL